MRRFDDAAVRRVFEAYPEAVRPKMLALRQLIFDTAQATAGVGPLHETLKWGEPAYLTAQSKSGSTVRIDWKAKAPQQLALYFNCQTNLVDTFRTLFPGELRFEGRRAVLLELDTPMPQEALGFCVAAALTYHLVGRVGIEPTTKGL